MISTLAGAALNFMALDPVKTFYCSAVVNGVLAAKVMATLMLIAGNKHIMGKIKLSGPMRVGGWAATIVMLTASIGLFSF